VPRDSNTQEYEGSLPISDIETMLGRTLHQKGRSEATEKEEKCDIVLPIVKFSSAWLHLKK